jgi:hypothetical protein
LDGSSNAYINGALLFKRNQTKTQLIMNLFLFFPSFSPAGTRSTQKPTDTPEDDSYRHHQK